MRLPRTAISPIVIATVLLWLTGCTLFKPTTKHAATTPCPGKVVVIPHGAPKANPSPSPGTGRGHDTNGPISAAPEPHATLFQTDAATYGVMVIPIGSYPGNRMVYFVECTNYQKEPIQFGKQNITVTDGGGAGIALYDPNQQNIYGKIHDLWHRYPNYRKQLLWPTFTVEPQLSYGGLVIVDVAPITNFSFDFAGQQCSVSFSVK
jgi:hypothetical protein